MFAKPSYPVVVIGAGIAGLSAATALHADNRNVVILERFEKAGGRLGSRKGDGWIADHGTPFFHRSDSTMANLVRNVGMEEHRVVIQGPVYRLTAEGAIEPPPGGGYDSNRLTLDVGFAEFTRRLGSYANIRYNCPVKSIHWEYEPRSFTRPFEGYHIWFTGEDGEPIVDPVTRDLFRASGVVLATTATVAEQIARSSKPLENLVPVFSGVRYDSTFVGIYKVPRFAGKWFAVQGDRDANIAWISAEERKAPERVDPEFSLLIVHASAEWSRKLIAEKEREAVHELWLEVRKVLPELPEKPISQTWKKWNVSTLASAPIGRPGADANFRWPTKPKDLPFALAGDYVGGPTLEDAARSGHDAAQQLIAQLPRRRRNPLLKIHIGQ